MQSSPLVVVSTFMMFRCSLHSRHYHVLVFIIYLCRFRWILGQLRQGWKRDGFLPVEKKNVHNLELSNPKRELEIVLGHSLQYMSKCHRTILRMQAGACGLYILPYATLPNGLKALLANCLFHSLWNCAQVDLIGLPIAVYSSHR